MRPRPALPHARAMNLIVATAALSAPTSAFALGAPATQTQAPIPPPQAPRPLGLRATPRHVRVGHGVRFTGRVPAIEIGSRVLLERRSASPAPWPAAAAWRRVASTRTDRRGRFGFRLVPRWSASYRAVIARAPIASIATSAMPVRVTVTARFRVTGRRLDLLGSHEVWVRGRLVPAGAGRRVVLERRTGHRWHRAASRRTGRRGGFLIHWRPGGRLPARLRLVFAGDASNGRAAFGLGAATVLHPSVASWYYDGGATACGFHATYGVANRTLPCGTRVMIRYGNRHVTAVVDDRGPYVWGRSWDLNQTTAARLGFSGVGTVWVGG